MAKSGLTKGPWDQNGRRSLKYVTPDGRTFHGVEHVEYRAYAVEFGGEWSARFRYSYQAHAWFIERCNEAAK